MYTVSKIIGKKNFFSRTFLVKILTPCNFSLKLGKKNFNFFMFFSLYSVQLIVVGAFVLNHPVYNIININNERDKLYGRGILLRYLLEKTILLIVNLVLLRAKKVGHQISVSFEKFDVVQALLSFF
jgi:hypothetical protein